MTTARPVWRSPRRVVRRPLIARGLPSAPDDMTMADAGAMLIDEPATVEAPSIDTSHLTLSELSFMEFDLGFFGQAGP